MFHEAVISSTTSVENDCIGVNGRDWQEHKESPQLTLSSLILLLSLSVFINRSPQSFFQERTHPTLVMQLQTDVDPKLPRHPTRPPPQCLDVLNGSQMMIKSPKLDTKNTHTHTLYCSNEQKWEHFECTNVHHHIANRKRSLICTLSATCRILFLSLSLSLTLSLSFTQTHTHTHILSLSFTQTHTHTHT